MTVYAQPGQAGAKVEFKARYENWIGGKWVPPTTGKQQTKNLLVSYSENKLGFF